MEDRELRHVGKIKLPDGSTVSLSEWFDTSCFVRNFTFPLVVGGNSDALHFQAEGAVPQEFVLRQLAITLHEETSAETKWIFATEALVTIGLKSGSVDKTYFEGPPFVSLAPRAVIAALCAALDRPTRVPIGPPGQLPTVYTPPDRSWLLVGLPLSIPLLCKPGNRWTVRIDAPKGLVLRGAFAGIGLLRRPVA